MMAVPPHIPPPPTGYFWQATPLPAPYAPLPLPAPTATPPHQQPVRNPTTLARPGIYTMPPTSHGLSDGATGIVIFSHCLFFQQNASLVILFPTINQSMCLSTLVSVVVRTCL
jgi:hypothetical protein